MKSKCNRDKSQNKPFTIILDFDPGNKRTHQINNFAQSWVVLAIEHSRKTYSLNPKQTGGAVITPQIGCTQTS